MNGWLNSAPGLEPGAEDYEPRIVVKFQDDNPLKLPYDESAAEVLKNSDSEIWRSVLDDKNGLQLTTLYEPQLAAQLQERSNEAQERAKARGRQYSAPNFFTYFALDPAPGSEADLETIAEMLRKTPFVEEAYVDRPGPDPQINATTEPRFAGQGYLAPAPRGIGVECAWQALGDGSGVSFIDVERGWTLNHVELAHFNLQGPIYGSIAPDSRSHGTSVLGIVCGALNGQGGVGIAPRLPTIGVASCFNKQRHNAIAKAIIQLGAGDVLLVEAQVGIQVNGAPIDAPVDAYAADNAEVRHAIELGIIVVETGGNGTNNGFPPALNLDAVNMQDTGAIIVSAATSAEPHTRLPFAPYGNRVDCYAWGENIDCCRSDGNGSTNLFRPDGPLAGFGGTSGAGAIIAGAMVVLQSIAKARGLDLDAWDWRRFLRDRAFGTEVFPTPPSNIGGVMPDLCRIIAALK
jgi:serine protease